MSSYRISERRSGLSTSRHGEDEEESRRATLAVVQAVEMARGKGLLPSPTELSMDITDMCTTLPPLRWHHWEHQPYKMRLTNTGCTVMVSAKWRSKVRAHLTGGPLLGRYVFSQLHFHWGQEDTEGSEHTFEGESFPLEMHMVLFKSRYLTQEAALKEMDGVVEVAYFFQLSKKDNPQLEPLVHALSKVKCAMKSSRFGPLPLSELVPSFETDYLMYMGSLLTGKCAHALTWIVRYQPLSISKRQLKALRSVNGLDGNPLLKNWRKAHPPMGRTVLHIMPPGTKIPKKSTREEVPEKRQTRFSKDWTENEPFAPPDEETETPKKSRRFFGCFGKRNQDGAEGTASIGSSGDSETAEICRIQPWLPTIAYQRSQGHPEVSYSTFRAMCETGHFLSMSSSSQHSSTAGEDAHDSRQETAAADDTERRRDVVNAAKHRPLDMGVMLLQPPQYRKSGEVAIFNPFDYRRSVGVTFLDEKGHHRAVMKPFSSLLSEVEEESERASEAMVGVPESDSVCTVVARDESSLLHRSLPPLKSPSPVGEEKKELLSMKDDGLEAGANGNAGMSVELSKYSLSVPVSPSDSVILEASSPIGKGTETLLLTADSEGYHGRVDGDSRKLSRNDDRDRNVTSGDCKLTELAPRADESSTAIPTFHRKWKGGISWWVPLRDNYDFTEDSSGNDGEGSTRGVAQSYGIDTFSLIAKTIVDNCLGILGGDIFSDTSTTTDTYQTGVTGGQRRTDLLSDSTVNFSPIDTTAQQSSEEQEALASSWQPQTPDLGFKGMMNIGSFSLSGYNESPSKNANGSPASETVSRNVYPYGATNVSIYPEGTYQTNDSNVSYTWNTRTRPQRRFDEEELRFPEIRIPKRSNKKPKVQRKRTSLSMSTLQDLQESNTNHSVFQRSTKDSKVKDRLNSWREMQSRKRTSRKSENKKQNRSKRRHRSSSSMDHLVHDSSSEDRSTMEKKASKKFKGPATTKTSDTVFPDGKSTKDGFECRRRERSSSSSSVSSLFSSSGAKRVGKVIDAEGIQELIGSGNEMRLHEISFHYVPCRDGAASMNKKHRVSAADHGDSAVGKSSTVRLHLKAPVDMNQLLKTVSSGSYITLENSGAYLQEREVTVGMVLVDTLRCEEGRETAPSSPQEIMNICDPQMYPEKSEDTPTDNSKDLSTSTPAEDCRIGEFAPASQLKSVVPNAGTHQMETSEAPTSNMPTITRHSPHRNRCCNAECWICQLSTIKVIQYTQGLDNSRDVPASEDSVKVPADSLSDMKPAGNEDETASPANFPTNIVPRSSAVFSRMPGSAQCSRSNERIPLPEPLPVGDVPLQENCEEDVNLQTSQKGNAVFESAETWPENLQLYRTTMEFRLDPPGIILSGNSNSSSSGGERTIECGETSKDVVPERPKEPKTAVYAANSSSCEETNNTVPLSTTNNENKRDGSRKRSAEIIDIYRKIKRRPMKRSRLSMEGIDETVNVDGLSSYTSCATDSDVSLIPYEDEPVPQSSNSLSLASGEDIPTLKNQGATRTGTNEDSRRNLFSYRDHKSTLKRLRLEYDILSKVMLYATLRKLQISSTSVGRPEGAQSCPGNQTCGSSEQNYMGDAFQRPLDAEVVRSLLKLPASKYEDTSTKSTWTGPKDLTTTIPEHSSSPQVLPVTPETESRRETKDTEERQQSVADPDSANVETNCFNTQMLAATSKTVKNPRTLCTTRSSTALSTDDDKLSNVVKEISCNDTEGESVPDTQDIRNREAIDFSSTSVSSNATKSQLRNKSKTEKSASIEGSVQEQQMCSVEVKQKVQHHPSRPPPPPQIRRPKPKPKRRQSRDRILSPREVYERRKMYAKNLALRLAQRANRSIASEEGETRSNLDDNQSASEEKSTGETSQKEDPLKNTKCVDDDQSVGSVKLGEAGNKSVSASKETTVKNFRDSIRKTQVDKKARVVAPMSENLKTEKDTSSCSTSSTKNNSASSNAKDGKIIGSRSLRSDIKVPGVRERTVRTSVVGHRRGNYIKEADKASVNTWRSPAGSEYSGGVPGTKRSPGILSTNVETRAKFCRIQGQALKSNSANDSASTKKRCLTQKQSKKKLLTKISPLGAVGLDRIEIIDKPSLCETWLKQHYSDSTLGSICGTSSVETSLQTVIQSTEKPDTELKVSGKPAVNSEKSATATESPETTVGTKGQVAPHKQKLASGGSGRLMIQPRADTVPLLTYKPNSAQVLEQCSAKRTPPAVDSLRTQAAGFPTSQNDVDGTRKKAKPLLGKSDEDTHRDITASEGKDSTDGRTEARELQKGSSNGSKTPTTISSPTPEPDRKSVATSPILLRKQSVILQDSRQMSLTVGTFSFCSTGVNTSLSVTHVSSRSLGVQCPSQGISKRPSATTGLFQSIIATEVKPDTHVYAGKGMYAMLSEVATKLEEQILVQKSVATQWFRRASVPNVALKSPSKSAKKTGKQKKRGSSDKRQGGTSPKPPFDFDLGLNEVQMENVRALHRRRLFRAFSTNSLALGTNEASVKKVMRRLFRKKRKKMKSDGSEGKSKGQKKKKKEEEQTQAASGGGGAGSPATGENINRGEETTEPNTDRSVASSATDSGDLSDPSGMLRKSLQEKLKEADEKDVSPRLLLVRGAETPQSPALFEDLEGDAGAGPNWCSVHNRPVEDATAHGGAEGDADEVSAAVAQVNTGARVLRVSLADEESTGCSDLGCVEFVVGVGEAIRPPPATTSVLTRLRRMLTWRS